MPLAISCATTTRDYSGAEFNFDQAASLILEERTQEEIEKRIGQPSQKILKGKHEWWDYNEKGTDYQRLSLKFTKDKQLESVLWVPRPDEPESKLDGLFKHYPYNKFHKLASDQVPSDSTSTDTMYSDNKSVTVLHNHRANRVEAITWYLEHTEQKSADSVSPKTEFP